MTNSKDVKDTNNISEEKHVKDSNRTKDANKVKNANKAKGRKVENMTIDTKMTKDIDKTTAIGEIPIEDHPLVPFLPENARLLMLGSFPPQQKRWCMDFYYPNFINDMWRIMGLLFFEDKDIFVDKEKKTFKKEDIVRFLNAKGIALFDTACRIRRLQDNASDKYLEVVTPTDIPEMLKKIPQCTAIVTTGEKATDTLCSTFNAVKPAIGSYTEVSVSGRIIRLYRMPSSSRAYPMKLEKKAEYYNQMMKETGLID